jgi:hypothetical protein
VPTSVLSVATDNLEAALGDLLARVESIVQDGRGEAGAQELLAAFRTTEDSDDRSGATSDTRARTGSLPGMVADRVPAPGVSRFPGGALAHRLIARATRRRDEIMLGEIRSLAQSVEDRLGELSEKTKSSGAVGVGEVQRQVQSVADMIAVMEGRLSAAMSRIDALEERLGRLDGGGFR